MTSREIIADLINKDLINGEQAIILLNDIFQSEILEAWKALNNRETAHLAKDIMDKNPSVWTYPNTIGIGGSSATTATWTAPDMTLTSASSSYSLSSEDTCTAATVASV